MPEEKPSKGVSTDIPSDHEIRKDVILRLVIPYPVIVRNESAHIYIGIQNVSDKLLEIGDLELDSKYQLMWQVRSKSGGVNIGRTAFVPEWGQKAILGDDNYYDTDSLKPLKYGESMIIWPYYRFPDETKEVRAALLVGPKQWVLSEWVPLRYAEKTKVSKKQNVFTAKRKVGPGTDIYNIKIEDSSYLMTSSRIARIPEGAKPRFEWDIDKYELTVHFDGVQVPPLVHYVPMIQARKWTADIAPHAKVLKDMKATFEKNKETCVKKKEEPKISKDKLVKPEK